MPQFHSFPKWHVYAGSRLSVWLSSKQWQGLKCVAGQLSDREHSADNSSVKKIISVREAHSVHEETLHIN